MCWSCCQDVKDASKGKLERVPKREETLKTPQTRQLVLVSTARFTLQRGNPEIPDPKSRSRQPQGPDFQNLQGTESRTDDLKPEPFRAQPVRGRAVVLHGPMSPVGFVSFLCCNGSTCKSATGIKFDLCAALLMARLVCY